MQYLYYSLILNILVISLFVRNNFAASLVKKDLTSQINKRDFNQINYANLQKIIEKQIRQKRSIDNSFEYDLRKKSSKKDFGCRRRSMHIDINDIGWENFVIAPTSFNSFYCEGSCTLSSSKDLDTTNHAILQTLTNSLQPDLYPSPCCVPTELAPLSMIIRTGDNSTSLKIFDNMIVTKCSCR